MVVENKEPGEVAPAAAKADEPTVTGLDVGDAASILGVEVPETDDDEPGVGEDSNPVGADPNGEAEESEADPDKKPAKLPPEVQAAVDKRIGKEVAKTKDLRAKLDTALAKISVLESKLETGAGQSESQSGIFGRDLLALSDEELDEHETNLLKLRRWARKYAATGYEGKEGEASFTAAEIQDRLDLVEEVLEEKLPKAKAVIEKRKAADERARKAFPALFDATSADSVQADALLKKVPELRRVPEYRILIGAMLEGFKALKKKGATVKKPEVPAVPVPGNKPNPSIPSGRAITAKPGEAVRKYLEGGSTMEALAGVVQTL